MLVEFQPQVQNQPLTDEGYEMVVQEGGHTGDNGDQHHYQNHSGKQVPLGGTHHIVDQPFDDQRGYETDPR